MLIPFTFVTASLASVLSLQSVQCVSFNASTRRLRLLWHEKQLVKISMSRLPRGVAKPVKMKVIVAALNRFLLTADIMNPWRLSVRTAAVYKSSLTWVQLIVRQSPVDLVLPALSFVCDNKVIMIRFRGHIILAIMNHCCYHTDWKMMNPFLVNCSIMSEQCAWFYSVKWSRRQHK